MIAIDIWYNDDIISYTTRNICHLLSYKIYKLYTSELKLFSKLLNNILISKIIDIDRNFKPLAHTNIRQTKKE